MTPVRSEVIDVMADCYRRYTANPSSVHRLGRAARERIEELRSQLGELLHARCDDRIVFTSGAVEANNLAVRGIASARTYVDTDELDSQNAPVRPDADRRLIISGIEHASVLEAAESLMDDGWRLDLLSASSDGIVRADQLASWITRDTALLSVTAANHETGVIQPLAELADICHGSGVPIHSDASQLLGKRAVDFQSLKIDAMSFSAQKFNGPPGVGALILKCDCPIRPIMLGGVQQFGLRPGTESVALVAGLVTALELRTAELDRWIDQVGRLRDRFEQLLLDRLPGIVVHGRDALRVANTTIVAFSDVDAVRAVQRLDRQGVGCSVGSACDLPGIEPSTTLRAMGVNAELARCSIRFSIGAATTKPEIDESVRRIVDAVVDMGCASH